MRPRSLLTTAALAIAVASGAARADVRYDFTAVSSYPVNGVTIAGSFSFIASDFITEDMTVPVLSLASCGATSTRGSRSRPADCLDQFFRPTDYAGYDAIGFNVATANPRLPERAVLYYFADDAFAHFGSYETVEFGTDQFAKLVVSKVSAVPEPSTWVSLLGGLGMLAVVRRRA